MRFRAGSGVNDGVVPETERPASPWSSPTFPSPTLPAWPISGSAPEPSHMDTQRVRTRSHGASRRKRYRVLRVLGAGSEGTVREAIDLETGRHVALKTITKPPSRSSFGDSVGFERTSGEQDSFSSEHRRKFEAISALRHPGLVELLDYFETSKIYMVSELAAGVSPLKVDALDRTVTDLITPSRCGGPPLFFRHVPHCTLHLL